MTPEKPRCSQITDHLREWRCSRRGVVQHDGRWYCEQHDPKAIEARMLASEAEWKARSEAANRAYRIKDAKRKVVKAAKVWADSERNCFDDEPLLAALRVLAIVEEDA